MWPLFPKSAPPIRPSLTLFFCLVGAFLLTVLPHVQQLPLWISLGIVAAMVIRSVIELRRWPLPSSIFCGILALCLFAGVYLQFRTVLGREAGTAFMVLLLAVKFFELRGPRDVALIIFSSFFVVMSSLLYSQAIELFAYCLIMMWVLTALLLRTSTGDLPDNRLLSMLRASALIFFQALPLALFLFFFFPRYHGTVQIGMDDSSIGLTDKLQPGSISRLAEDDSTAMTVKFTGENIPATDTMYWRAVVLWDYENGIWTPGAGALPLRDGKTLPPPAPKSNSSVSQEITIYPHLHRWLFALDYPVTPAVPIDGSSDWSEALNGSVLQLHNLTSLYQKERYTVTSCPTLAPQELDPFRKVALQLPADDKDTIDPGVQALAVKLKEGCATDEAYIRSVLHYFRHEGFIYSDSPGAGADGEQGLADFLLRRKRGFCEHYASAFAVLMRLGGVPSRVVVGYFGAQFNPYKDIFIVKQSNAHSWDEVWIENERRWERVDPTTVLSRSDNQTPSSAEQARAGADEGLSIQVAHHRLTFVSGAALPSWMRRGLLEMQLRRQEIEADWDDWVFSYDPQTQNRWAQALGLGRQAGLALGLACLLAFVVSGLVLGFAMKRRPSLSAAEAFYKKFCRQMAHRGVPRSAWEGPLAYTERVAEAFPEKRKAIEQVGRIVAQDRYGRTPPVLNREELNSIF